MAAAKYQNPEIAIEQILHINEQAKTNEFEEIVQCLQLAFSLQTFLAFWLTSKYKYNVTNQKWSLSMPVESDKKLSIEYGLFGVQLDSFN